MLNQFNDSLLIRCKFAIIGSLFVHVYTNYLIYEEVNKFLLHFDETINNVETVLHLCNDVPVY
jgi:hypothetical protein